MLHSLYPVACVAGDETKPWYSPILYQGLASSATQANILVYSDSVFNTFVPMLKR